MDSKSEHKDVAPSPSAACAPDRRSYFAKALATRSLGQAPLATIWRALSYVVLTRAHIPVNFRIAFGDVSFKMRLQNPKPQFGIANIYLQRRYYEPLLEFGHSLLSPGETAIDGGASQGVYTCAFAAKVGAQGKVYGFEPLDYAVQCLRNNIALNGFQNVGIFEGALSEATGRAFIDIGHGPSYASIVHDFGHRKGGEVQTFSIDELREQRRIGAIEFIKLDIEGAELAALKGARETLEKDKPRLCLEANEKDEFERVVTFLAPFKLRPYVFDSHGKLYRFDRFLPAPNVFFLA